ncbi:MAG: cytochrome P450, partial [Pseudomonadota bacterium]
MTPPKPPSRREGASLWARIRLFREDMFRSQPERLYRAWMAELRTPLYRCYTINDPALVREVLRERPGDFPKHSIIGRTLSPLLGRSVFVTNGAVWEAQRRIIDPAFQDARLGASFVAMNDAVADAVVRWPEGEADVEALTSHLAADIIFRTLFSQPITHADAAATFDAFQAYQRAQPVLSPLDLLKVPQWVPRGRGRGATHAAAIRAPLARLVAARQEAIAAGTAPDDLATRIMTTPDPVTGRCFEGADMVDQVAIFFLAGHETSASAMAWALYLLASHGSVQDACASEAAEADLTRPAGLRTLPILRNVIRETLRLYPPVPVMVREVQSQRRWRGREIRPGSMVFVSPWHLHRHERLWDDPDAFRPDRWEEDTPKAAYLPFSAGPRVCPGQGFAQMEMALALAALLRHFQIE